jgi:hypothetical protein
MCVYDNYAMYSVSIQISCVFLYDFKCHDILFLRYSYFHVFEIL